MLKNGLFYTILIFCVSFFFARMAFAAGQMVKLQREDFSQVIQDGLENEKVLRNELQKSVGLTNINQDIRPVHKTRIVRIRNNENVAIPSSPTHVEKQPTPPSYTDITQQRISQEVEAAGH